MLPSTACPHPQPLALALLAILPCSVHPQVFTLLETLMKTSLLNEGKIQLKKNENKTKKPKKQNKKPHPNQTPSYLLRTHLKIY